jgi:hypothetical protein
MEIAGNRPSAQRWVLIALVALLGLVITAGASNAGASGHGQAVAAKKHCKKKGKKSAAVAKKKKKCKKKGQATPVAPTVAPPVLTPPKGPIERIRITWTGGADLDVHAWSNGLHDGWNETLGTSGDYEVQIPGTTYDNSESGGDNESIVETNPNPSVPMTFGICNYPNPLVSDADVTVKWVLADGTTQTDEFLLAFDDFTVDDDEQGGPADPADEWCPLAV